MLWAPPAAQSYDSAKQLRYGHLMIMTDQDHDGSHIKGLIMNFLHHFYPSLLRVPGFLLEFITPIVKVLDHCSPHHQSSIKSLDYAIIPSEMPDILLRKVDKQDLLTLSTVAACS
jgi:DNA gyrase/topoisomerase IV subunit B